MGRRRGVPSRLRLESDSCRNRPAGYAPELSSYRRTGAGLGLGRDEVMRNRDAESRNPWKSDDGWT